MQETLLAERLSPLDAESFRRHLAGAVDHGSDVPLADLRDEASDLVFYLFRHFNREKMDPKTQLLGRVGSAMELASDQRPHTIDEWIALALDHVLANPAKVAADDQLADSLTIMRALPIERQLAVIDYLRRVKFVALTLGRDKWKQSKGAIE